MKKRSKKLVAILSAILVAASALAAVPVSAYWLPSQNREILYYDFDFGNQLTHYGSSLLLKKNEEGGLQKWKYKNFAVQFLYALFYLVVKLLRMQ